uniref:Insulin-like domain-containing protein n=1 Tax=Plectus sambesii TaxID=2011161 RepID=A0A914XD58_9BILA
MNTCCTALTVIFLILLLSGPSFAKPRLCGHRFVRVQVALCSPSREEGPCFRPLDLDDFTGLKETCCSNGCTYADLKKNCCTEDRKSSDERPERLFFQPRIEGGLYWRKGISRG